MLLHPGTVRLFSRALDPYAFEMRPHGETGYVLLVFERLAAEPLRFEVSRADMLDRSLLSQVLVEIREALTARGYFASSPAPDR